MNVGTSAFGVERRWMEALGGILEMPDNNVGV